MGEQKPRVIRPMEAQVLKGHCGNVVRLLAASEGRGINVDRVTIISAVEHKHGESDEYYYVLHGRGNIYLDNKREEIYNGCLIPIPKGTWHRAEATGESPLEVLVWGVPSVQNDDIHYREDESA